MDGIAGGTAGGIADGIDGAAVDALFAAWDRPDSPGAVWAVTQNGAEVHAGAAGMADLSQGVRLDRRSVVRIGSQTKQFTVLLLMMLEAEGRLSLEDEVHAHAPWLPAFPHPVTLRHLATNTSGLRDVLEVMALSGLPLVGPAGRERQREVLAAHEGVNFVPGTRMTYCNTGFWLLSEIVERVSGQPFEALLAERITGPLGMADTRLVRRDTQVLPRLSAQHVRGAGGAWETARWGWEIGGEGGMVSTLEDMVRWQGVLHAPPPGMAPLLARMAEPVRYANGARGLYASGLIAEEYRGLRHVGHGGSVAGGRSESMRFVEAGVGIVVLANLDAIAPYSLALRIADVVLADRLEARPTPGAPLPAGLFRDGGELLRVEGDRMVTGAGPAPLREVSPGRFIPERPTMDLVLEADGADGLRATWCGEVRRMRRTGTVRGTPPGIAGRYADTGTGLAIVVEEREGGAGLVLRSAFGVQRLRGWWIDADLLAYLPDTGQAMGEATAAAWPGQWAGTVAVMGDGLVLTTDRTRELRLGRVA